jgi:hypothetical protein
MGFLDPRPPSRAEVLQLTGPALTEDAADPGTFIIKTNRLTEDPADPGTFLIGA